ncbi:hypothetical protein QQL38_03740 [Pseudomonas syringae]|uniref:hypothetical protein n=1 Tax=Pseudomonas syringae TaxID=317 RepID=UPI0020BF6766|nr:hypothetical protein [Pseudomonas syringae]MCL6308453.1 hypothetical protein [Pseudomonas syringae]
MKQLLICAHFSPGGAPANIWALGSVRKVAALGDASLKTGSECSFTTRRLRFLACFCLA